MIETLLDLTNYATDTRVARRKTGKKTQEFFTPYSIVKRMGDKIPDSDWADPTKTFLESSFGNGQYDVKDFLELMEKKEVEKKTGIKKFDICLMNPPYGSTGGSMIHLQFVDKCLEIANKQVSIFPFTFITKINHKRSKQYKPKFDNYLISVDEVNSKNFNDTRMPNVGIYYFDNEKKHNEKIKITKIKSNTEEFNSLSDISEFNKYEQNFINYLKNNGQLPGCWAAGHSHCTKKSLAKQGITEPNKVKKLINEEIIKSCKNVEKNKVYMTCPNANFSARFISGRYGDIFKTYEDFINFVTTKTASSGYIVLFFDNLKSAENCKIALQNPLLRFTLYKTKDDQNMPYNKVYIYIPNIDWSNDKVKTDEGLLELCGCPKDKCKEYADYCKKIINEVDNGEKV